MFKPNSNVEPIEVLTQPEQRRRRSVDEKLVIVRETFEPAGTKYFLMGETAMGWTDGDNSENYGTIARYIGPSRAGVGWMQTLNRWTFQVAYRIDTDDLRLSRSLSVLTAAPSSASMAKRIVMDG